MGSFFTNLDNWLIIAAIAGQSFDAGTTLTGIRNGRCEEANPLMRNEKVMAGAKSGLTFTLAWGGKKAPKGVARNLFRVGLATAAGAGFAAGTLNYNRCIK